jgi:hypothetical protein
MENPTVISFAPDRWGQLERFAKFHSGTFQFTPTTQKALSGAINHFRKAVTFKNLAVKLVPNLELDEKELEAHGYTPALNSKELSAVIEGVTLELYSSIDCTRKIISEIYGRYPGITKDSTRKLFQNAFDNKIDERVPEFLRTTIKEANWYPAFRKVRDELTHSDIGSCHRDTKTGKVFYMHSGFQIDGRALVIEDIFGKIEEDFSNVNGFLGKVYAHLNTLLSDKEVWQMCGIFGGRIYSRFVVPSQAIDFNSGYCDAFRWFEKEPDHICPLIERCGAYKNRRLT